MKRKVEIVRGLMSIDTNTEYFDMQDIENRRFMYSPQTGTLLLGVQYSSNAIFYSHAEEHHKIGVREDFDRFVRGWIGTGKDYKDGIIHFAPIVPASAPSLFNKGFDTLEMFRANNANDNTIVRGFGRRWEQPLSDIITKNKEVDIMSDKNIDADAIGTRQTAVQTAEPPKSSAKSIKLTGKNHKDRLKEITDILKEGIKDVFASDKYKEYLSVMSKFHKYSFRNTLLILMQKPDAAMVAGYGAWQKNFKRQVKRGETGISIIAPSPYKTQQEIPLLDKITHLPMYDAAGKPLTQNIDVTIPSYKVTTVFDVSQTDGEPLPQLGVDELQGDVMNYENMFKALEKISPVPIAFENIEGGAKGYFHREEKRIAIQENMSELQTLKTAIHEVAHAKLHDISKEELKDIPPEERKDSHTREVEAESVAFTVCMRYGLDTSDYTFGYVAGWSSSKEAPELESSLATIQKMADEIISGIDEQLAELNKDKEQNISNDDFTDLSEADAADGAKVFEPEDNSKDTPTIDELEAKAKSGEPVAIMDIIAANEVEKAKTSKAPRLTADEKEIKDAVMDILKGRIDYENNGMLSTYRASDKSFQILNRYNVHIQKDDTVTRDDRPLFKVHHRYSQKKTNGCYHKLNPTLEYVWEKEKKPSIKKQLAEAKEQAAKQPKKSDKVKNNDLEVS